MDELDLVLLLALALAATILGLADRLDFRQLATVILALLAILAIAQIRTRELLRSAAAREGVSPLARLLSEYPGDLERRRAAAKDVLLIGNGLRRTSKAYSRHIQAALLAGSRVRILLPNPTHVRHIGNARLAREIEESIITLSERVPPGRESSLEVRVMDGFPPANFNVLDPARDQGSVVVGYHEFEPVGESAPILDLQRSDGDWYEHFVQEAARLWDAGVPYSAEARGTRSETVG